MPRTGSSCRVSQTQRGPRVSPTDASRRVLRRPPNVKTRLPRQLSRAFSEVSNARRSPVVSEHQPVFQELGVSNAIVVSSNQLLVCVLGSFGVERQSMAQEAAAAAQLSASADLSASAIHHYSSEGDPDSPLTKDAADHTGYLHRYPPFANALEIGVFAGLLVVSDNNSFRGSPTVSGGVDSAPVFGVLAGARVWRPRGVTSRSPFWAPSSKA